MIVLRCASARKPLGHGVVEKSGQRVEVARDVEDPARFGVNAELAPRQNLEESFQRSDAARQGDEPVAQIRHRDFR